MRDSISLAVSNSGSLLQKFREPWAVHDLQNPVHPTNRIFSLLTYKRIPIIGIYSNYPIFAATNGIFSLSHVSKIPTIGICSNYVSKLDGLDHAYSKGK